MLSQGLPGNSCAYVLELDGRLDIRDLERRIAEASVALPELSWSLKRKLNLQPVWRGNGMPPARRVSERPLRAPIIADVLGGLDQVSAAKPWVIELLHGPDNDVVLFRWLAPLGDARGIGRLLTWLGSGSREVPAADRRYVTPESRLDDLSSAEKLKLSGAYNDYLFALAKRPIASLHTVSGNKRPGRTCAVRVRFDEDETRDFYRSVRKRAMLADTSIITIAATRMLDRALAKRGYSPPHHVLPVPLSLDPKGACGRMFGNNLTMMMMSLSRDELADERAAVASLAKQRRTLVRDKLDLAMLAALDRARVLPGRVFNMLSRLPFHGERTSLVVSNPGAVEIEEFLGKNVADAYTIPSAMAPPGFQVIGNRHGGRLSLLVVFLDGAISSDEVTSLVPALRADILGH